jgi:hypothetical protein
MMLRKQYPMTRLEKYAKETVLDDKVRKHDAKEAVPDDVENFTEGNCRLNETEGCSIFRIIVNARKKKSTITKM